LHFGNNFIADFHVDWLSPVEVRRNLIGGTRRMLVYGDMELIEKIRIYDRGIQVKSHEEVYKAPVAYRMGDVSSPKLDMREALSFECEHFVDCVRNKKVPRSDGMAGLAVVRILEAASISLQNDCARVALFRGAESNAPPLPQKERLL
jgi:predicted dehydrogenase